eukprot:CAMPEP_0178904276 /NCGR_PEP_ID=MMETSP0786-20121207/5608_1 /TAXON_ID=186022 /ORGANISM="Thalassionema frauenfeldii, Strain CCMP 1798" /LENGTH=688 /DNA_ID=CAMNT_0020575711 /DNA_START=72 /DNA_END=2138 /DNA_ORIENTATION=-
MLDETNPHDQLPTVEEVTGRSSRDERNYASRRKSWCKGIRLVLCVSLFALVGIAIAVIVALNLNSQPPQSMGVLEVKDVMALIDNTSASLALEDKNSPQYQAAEWVANLDEASLGLPRSEKDKFALLQRYYVAVFAIALDFSRWRYDFSFFSPGSVCSWNWRVRIGESRTYLGVLCNQRGEVDAILLPENRLAGEFPDEISNLSNLRLLWLSGNRINGTLPTNMQSLTNMTGINVGGNKLSGSIPAWLSKLTKLEHLHMQGNKLENSIPSELGDLSTLTYLDLKQNDLSGKLPVELGSLSNLVRLDLGYNDLSGDFPSWFDNSMTKLGMLRLSNNKLKGSLPDTLGSMTSLRALFLDDNQFTGDVGPINQLTTLRSLFIEDNFFEGDIESLMENAKDLQILDASDNLLHGSIPENLFSGKELLVLDLHANFLDGSLPRSIPAGLPLEFLSLHENDLEGEIPWEAMSNWTSLQHLDLSSNAFTGPMVTSNITQMNQLIYLFLANNTGFDEGSIPDELNALTNLKELSLKSTRRTGVIPSWIGDLRRLLLLDIDSNNLTGSIPEQIGKLFFLQFLLLNRNNLDGDLPADILSRLPFLTMLLLDQNNITGSASELCAGDKIATNLQEFVADCGNGFTCPCCTLCCEDDNCNDGDFLSPYEPIWEDAYIRNYWNFTDDESSKVFQPFFFYGL